MRPTTIAGPGLRGGTGWHPDHRFDSIEAATAGMTALHATEVSTPYISLHARMDHLIVDDVDRALYDDRSIVRTMAMRLATS